MAGLLSGIFSGSNFDEIEKRAVWEKGTPIPGCDASEWRYDTFGNVLCFGAYGDRSSRWGWEIDHYPTPVSLGGTNNLANLRPLHCSANASLGGALGGILSRVGRGGGLG